MADCGATGTALDRAVAAATSGGASKQAVASLVGHASMGSGGVAATMPAAPPTFLSTAASGGVGGLTSMPPAARAMHPSPELHQRPPPLMAFQQHAPPHMRSTMQQHPMAMQQQQHHMMMIQQQQQMAMMQQHQQQLMMMQQQQQQDANSTHAHLKDEHDAETEHASNKEPEWKENPTLDDWHEGLEEEAAVQGHEGWTQGASIEELAAAWAQAEAEYEEYVVSSV